MKRSARREMLATIGDAFVRTAHRTGLAAPAPAVQAAMAAVRREQFLPPERSAQAWDDAAVAIGHGQTMSQPFVVALMSTLLQPQPHHRVLEIGTGSGYQAAVLAAMVAEVFTIEVVPALAHRAAATLQRPGCEHVHVRLGDGGLGWPEQAPFDGILVTCGGPEVPAALLAQLAPGGHLVMPVGSGDDQRLLDITVAPDGTVRRRDVLGVRFVPFVRP